MRCGWCETNNPAGEASCVNCAGPLSRPGAEPGPSPPPTPRSIPARFVRRVMRSGTWFGAAFGAIGLLVTALFLVGAFIVPLSLIGLVISVPFVFIGGAFARSGRQKAQRRIAVLRDGRAADGAVLSVAVDGPGAWRLRYAFDGADSGREGDIVTTNAEVTRYQPGHRLWVVWLADGASDVWPPLG